MMMEKFMQIVAAALQGAASNKDMTPEELAHEKQLAHEKASASEVGSAQGDSSNTHPLWVVLAWTAVGIPLAWGIYRTVLSVSKFFN
jgi:hypothetical protein